MSIVEKEAFGRVLVIRLNRPERLNAASREMFAVLRDTWAEFRVDDRYDVAILTGTGRAFCAGEDMKETVETGTPDPSVMDIEDPTQMLSVEKPIIAAVNGFAMGAGFLFLENTDLRVAVRDTVLEVSEAKRWLLGGYAHGFLAGLPHPIATEMALGYRFTSERLYELGFINRLVDPDDLMPTALAMAEHLLTLPPASLVNTVHMMRQMRPRVSAPVKALGSRLHRHGALQDLLESRTAFVEKRAPQFIGWDKPEDRFELPTLED
jgi:enoyl-CoA hydratase/carnithine racemase